MNAVGIDVSHHAYVEDLGALVATGYSFLGVKATQGLTFVDPKLVYHRDLLRANAGIAGTIFYHYPNKANDPAREAAHFLQAIGPLRDNERLALDVEQGASGKDAPPIEWQREFVAELPQDRGRVPLIYTAAHVWNEIGNPPWPDATVGKVDLWLKRYASDYGSCPSPWSFPTFWQNSDSATVAGVSATADTDVFMPGDVAALRKYLWLEPATQEAA